MSAARREGPAEPLDERGSEIVAVDCFPARLPLRKPLVMSTYRLDSGPVLFVRLRARSGAEGWGEAAASPVMSGETLTGMAAALRELIAPVLCGVSVHDRARLSRRLRAAMFGNGAVLAATDLALLDLAGRIRGVPAVDLLGGAVRRSLAPLWLVGGSGETDSDVADALELRDAGFRCFKLKVGIAPVEQEIETVRRLREALGPDALIAADANMGWDVATALRFAQGAASHGLAFLEQPVAAGDIERLARVAARSPVPIGADENIHGLGDILSHMRAGAVAGVSLKTVKLGGVTPVCEAAVVANALGLGVNFAMMMESSLAAAAMVHAACAVPQLDWKLSLGNLWLSEDPVTAPLGCTGGLARLPTGPGLGVTVDERHLADLAP